MRKQSAGLRWRLPAAAVLAGLALAAASASAQTSGQLVITEPDAWQEGRAVVVPAGQSLHIEGFATHPEGVSRILVNGQPVHLVAAASGVFRFDATVVAGDQARQVVITVEPLKSRPFSQSYSLAVSGAAAAPSSAQPQTDASKASSAPAPTLPSDTSRGKPTSTPGRTALPHALHNPWKPFTFRGLGYVALAAGGLYLATRQSTSTSKVCSGPPDNYDCVNRTVTSKSQATVGSGVAGGAVLVGIVDALLTAHRASRAQETGSERGQLQPVDPPGLRIGPALLQPILDDGRLTLLRLSF